MRIRVDLTENGWLVADEQFEEVLVDFTLIDELMAIKDIEMEVGQSTMIEDVSSVSSDKNMVVIRT